ncbi:magnesium protoporphyrin IX methyltransferase [Aurantiacibacter sp. MUD61]|uniref:magnesium protoporphyrin IX methyltransferase n=1 Tax=Aurantiacibacter sp. MUD61 TaxID=3009083 RepID=UPI0022EFEB82|nr:magnesium protoporphyrin IX methyltransferase [Aurantiacibacter sp. MUD61]
MATRAPTQYDAQREKLAAYFDGTARKAWIDLTSDAKVSGIRATVRAGRDEMRSTLLDWLPADLRRSQLLDAGCGTGALSMEAACRGAEVTAIDVAGGLVDIAKQRADSFHGHGRIHWKTGDMLDPALGTFDHIVAMDSLIHYRAEDIVETLAVLSERAHRSILFTFAPYTKLLGTMHKVGKLFPRSDRSPAIVPVAEDELRDRLSALTGWRIARSHRVSSGFYTSHALKLVKS